MSMTRACLTRANLHDQNDLSAQLKSRAAPRSRLPAQ
jgi:hypothetical protein